MPIEHFFGVCWPKRTIIIRGTERNVMSLTPLQRCALILQLQLRTQALQHTALSQAQPSTVISKLFKIAVQVRQYKNKIVLHLPSECPVKYLLQTLTERLYLPTPANVLNSS
ncbi:MAG: transposase [Burkholderiaceae bacterium]